MPLLKKISALTLLALLSLSSSYATSDTASGEPHKDHTIVVKKKNQQKFSPWDKARLKAALRLFCKHGNEHEYNKDQGDFNSEDLDTVLKALATNKEHITITDGSVQIKLNKTIDLRHSDKIFGGSNGLYKAPYAEVQALFLPKEWYNNPTYRFYALLRQHLILSASIVLMCGAAVSLGSVYGILKHKHKKNIKANTVKEIDIDGL